MYRDQGVSIHDKHIELIVRQMTRRVAVLGARRLRLPARRAGRPQGLRRHQPGRWSRRARRRPRAVPSSWASPRRRWPPTRGCRRRRSRRRPGCSPRPPSSPGRDSLLGLKENIIIGKLIPAGTGMRRYRDIETDAPDYQPMAFYSSDADEPTRPSGWPRIGSDGDGDGRRRPRHDRSGEPVADVIDVRRGSRRTDPAAPSRRVAAVRSERPVALTFGPCGACCARLGYRR